MLLYLHAIICHRIVVLQGNVKSISFKNFLLCFYRFIIFFLNSHCNKLFFVWFCPKLIFIVWVFFEIVFQLIFEFLESFSFCKSVNVSTQFLKSIKKTIYSYTNSHWQFYLVKRFHVNIIGRY